MLLVVCLILLAMMACYWRSLRPGYEFHEQISKYLFLPYLLLEGYDIHAFGILARAPDDLFILIFDLV